MRDANVKAVESYLQGLKNKDLSGVPFAPDVTFESPLSPKITGVETVTNFLTGLFPAVKDIRVKQHIVEDENVVTLFDFDTTFGVIEVCDTFKVTNGQVKQIRPYYDPRIITNPAS